MRIATELVDTYSYVWRVTAAKNLLSMNKEFINELARIFTPNQIKVIWEHRNSDIDILPIDSILPIRNKLNANGTRNIEILLTSRFGDMWKTLTLIESDTLYFPREYAFLRSAIDTSDFNLKAFTREIDLVIGAYSLDCLSAASGGIDTSFTANNIDYELFVATDGSLQTFLKEQKTGFGMFDPMVQLMRTDLDQEPLSSFMLQKGGNIQIRPTIKTNEMVSTLINHRLLSLFNKD